MNRKYIYLACSLILIIVAVLASMTLYEILQASSNPDTFEIESVTWNMTRPVVADYFVHLNESVSNAYISDEAAVGLEVVVRYFIARRSTEVHNITVVTEYEHLALALSASAIISEGFVHSMVIKFSSELHNSSLNIDEDPEHFTLRNIEIHEIADRKAESYIDAQAVGKPESCMFADRFEWTFYDLNTLDHQMLVTLEATYFNGTGYRKAVIPTQLAALSSP
ncbi:MAG: hypothetical protein AM326_05390 [Candidatus Thorarchaeota archaeon SMTZ-45]|nr:MAG: hypothetical protein AM326_05390 [Candidatus Thorarchaeota archaeon SMTZ-45]